MEITFLPSCDEKATEAKRKKRPQAFALLVAPHLELAEANRYARHLKQGREEVK